MTAVLRPRLGLVARGGGSPGTQLRARVSIAREGEEGRESLGVLHRRQGASVANNGRWPEKKQGGGTREGGGDSGAGCARVRKG
jgi:hypothetical protein